MTKKRTKRAPAAPRKGRTAASNIDWPSVERDYRAGFPLADLQRAYGVSEGQISKRQRAEGWTRDARTPQAAVQADIARRAIERARRLAAGGSADGDSSGDPPGDGAAVPHAFTPSPSLTEEAGSAIGSVVDRHRARAERALAVGAAIHEELAFVMSKLGERREQLLKALAEGGNQTGQPGRRKRTPPDFAAMNLYLSAAQSAADLYKTLAQADAAFIDIERVANGLTKGDAAPPGYDEIIKALERTPR